MRRLIGFIVITVAVLAQPAYADDLTTQQQDVRQQLAAAAVQITQLNTRMATLEQSVSDTQRRIQREKAQVRMLARALYAQPDSLVATVFESASIAEAMTRIADLTSAGDRAVATKRQLDQDLTQLSLQRTQLQTDRDRQEQLRLQLTAQFAKLVQEAAAGKPGAGTPMPPVLPPRGGAADPQIIIDAVGPPGRRPVRRAGPRGPPHPGDNRDVMKLDGAVAVITGGASGIGRACALAMAAKGADVVIADLDEERMGSAVAEVEALGRRALGVRCDVSRDGELEGLAERAIREMGGVDLLMNNAGVVLGGPVEKISMADWEWIVGINLLGPGRRVREFLPHMLEPGGGPLGQTPSVP